MDNEKNEAEPSGASGGSPVCPYVTGTVTRYCTLTPLTLTDAERAAIQRLIEDYEGDGEPASHQVVSTLRAFLERHK